MLPLNREMHFRSGKAKNSMDILFPFLQKKKKKKNKKGGFLKQNPLFFFKN